MVYPSFGGGPVYIPPPGGALELNIGDQWRARWVDQQELPATAPVDYAYAVVCMENRGYVARRAGEGAWGTVEGDLRPGERPDAFVKRAAREQTGAVAGKVELIGFLECRATRHNTAYPTDAVTLRPLYLVVAKQMKDVPEESGFERRRLPMNEFLAALRTRYPELELYLSKAAERYAVMRAKGEA